MGLASADALPVRDRVNFSTFAFYMYDFYVSNASIGVSKNKDLGGE